jgi:hypothetical protein
MGTFCELCGRFRLAGFLDNRLDAVEPVGRCDLLFNCFLVRIEH